MQLTATSWTKYQRILFRFIFSYFILFILIENNGAFPLWGYLMTHPTEWLHSLIPWVGRNILHLSYKITVFANGSGDTTYNYVIVFLIFSMAILASMIWSISDWNRQHYKKLYYWLTVAIRFYVALMLINYGIVKVFKIQFPYPGLYRLTQPYGDSSPMGLCLDVPRIL